MKHILYLLFLSPVLCIAQLKTAKADSSRNYKAIVYCDTCASAKIINDTLFLKGRKEIAKTDTIKVMMLLTDTSELSGTTLNGNGIVFWQIGYEVRIALFVCCDPNDKLNSSYYWMYSHASYLNGDKKELSKSITVWQSKQY